MKKKKLKQRILALETTVAHLQYQRGLLSNDIDVLLDSPESLKATSIRFNRNHKRLMAKFPGQYSMLGLLEKLGKQPATPSTFSWLINTPVPTVPGLPNPLLTPNDLPPTGNCTTENFTPGADVPFRPLDLHISYRKPDASQSAELNSSGTPST
jgi:hypothetical protein